MSASRRIVDAPTHGFPSKCPPLKPAGVTEEDAVRECHRPRRWRRLAPAAAHIEGPVYIGPGATVGPNSYLGPNTVILDGCKVGNASEIQVSLPMAGAHVGELSYVGDSVLGERVNLGAGALVANDGKPIKVTQEGQRVETGRRKLGVIIGDDVHTGIDTSLNVGVMLPVGGATSPGEVE